MQRRRHQHAEIFSNGAFPYDTQSDIQVIKGLAHGIVLPCPSTCPSSVYQIMVSCWKPSPAARLSPAQLHSALQMASESAVLVASQVGEASVGNDSDDEGETHI